MKPAIDFNKYTAHRLHLLFEEKYLKGGLLKKPLWLNVMRMYPPLAIRRPLIHHSPPEHARLLQRSGLHDRRQYIVEQQARAPKVPSISSGWREKRGLEKKLASPTLPVYAYPQPIVFAEDDAVRQRFHAQHPLEALRPVQVKEDLAAVQPVPKTAEQVMASLFGGAKVAMKGGEAPKPPSVVDAHSLVQYQHWLMQYHGESQQAAYAEACKQLYQHRRAASTPTEADEHAPTASKEWLEREQWALDRPVDEL